MIPKPSQADMERSALADYGPERASRDRIAIARAWIRRCVAAEKNLAWLMDRVSANRPGTWSDSAGNTIEGLIITDSTQPPTVPTTPIVSAARRADRHRRPG